MDLPTTTKWQNAATAERYAQGRWSNTRRSHRDLRLVRRALGRHGVPTGGRVLDAPCGTGRLLDAVATGRQYVGVDVSGAMLALARLGGCESVVRAQLESLPMADRTFGLVVACRILHHLGDDDLQSVVGELVRVSSGWIIASFWDRATVPALRRRVAGRLGRKRFDRRRTRSRSEIEATFAAAGARLVGFEADTRVFSQQCFAVARR